LKNGYKLVQCSNCGLAYINPQPLLPELQQYYQGTYGELYVSTPRKMESKFRDARRELRRLKKLSKISIPKLLDVGCSFGYLVKIAHDAGWEAVGVDPSRHAVEFAQNTFKINVMTGDIFSPHLPEDHFDFITMFDVIEHHLNPLESLHRAHELLKAGGFLIIGVPDFGHYKAKKSGVDWGNFIPPEHLFYFNLKTIKKICGRAGFTFHKQLPRSPLRDALKTVYRKEI
jgi:SAM-dependent methyltransferase